MNERTTAPLYLCYASFALLGAVCERGNQTFDSDAAMLRVNWTIVPREQASKGGFL